MSNAITQSMSVLAVESRFELLRTLRMPGFLLPTLLFPAAFYLLFAVVMPMGKGSFDMASYLLAGYGVFGVIGPALFGFGVAVANERNAGWLLLKMASPMPITIHFAARVFMSLTFAAVVALMLFTLGAVFADIRMQPMQWVSLFFILVLGVIPFCAMGLMVGYWARSQAAVAIVNLIYLPMSVLSGLWWPMQLFPAGLQVFGKCLPPYHLVQLALTPIGMNTSGAVLEHILVLLAYTAVFLLLAARGYRRDAAARGA
ncbi:MAG: ABC transporter [Lysobacteraceae bacterium]|nr:MAG: ABC transporter [Xanthomonadaceae bacterium]